MAKALGQEHALASQPASKPGSSNSSVQHEPWAGQFTAGLPLIRAVYQSALEQPESFELSSTLPVSWQRQQYCRQRSEPAGQLAGPPCLCH